MKTTRNTVHGLHLVRDPFFTLPMAVGTDAVLD